LPEDEERALIAEIHGDIEEDELDNNKTLEE
jgi:hypothetical protein